MNAVERMVEYTSQPTEGSSQTHARPPPQGWPTNGAIIIDKLQVQRLCHFSSLRMFECMYVCMYVCMYAADLL